MRSTPARLGIAKKQLRINPEIEIRGYSSRDNWQPAARVDPPAREQCGR